MVNKSVCPIFILFFEDRILAQGQTMMLSSRNNVNTKNTFVDLTE